VKRRLAHLAECNEDLSLADLLSEDDRRLFRDYSKKKIRSIQFFFYWSFSDRRRIFHYFLLFYCLFFYFLWMIARSFVKNTFFIFKITRFSYSFLLEIAVRRPAEDKR
jgi:hypothetical protein